MNIIEELIHLPTYAYTFYMSGKMHLALLGGHSCVPINDIRFADSLIDKNYEMQQIFEKDVLNETEKTRLAILMHQISNLCEGRLENNRTIEQQTEYLNTLTSDAISEIEWQIKMYKAARIYYSQYVYRK